MRRTMIRRLMVMAAMILAMLAFASPAWARTFTVDRTDDITPPSGVGTCSPTGAFDCTLRGAIQVSNTNGETDTIEFGPAVRGEILLTEPLTVANDTPADHGLTINGPGQDVLTVRQSPNVQLRVFQIVGKTTINGMTISGGRSPNNAGGILNNGGANLTLNETTVTDNQALGTVADTGAGGGIYNASAATLTLNKSTVSANKANISSSGGIHLDTDLPSGPSKTTVTNSTISGNTASFKGGGINNAHGLTVIEHSTITKNTASAAAGVSSYGDTAFASTHVLSTIISANTNTDVDFVAAPENTFLSKGFNRIGDGNATAAFNKRGDQTLVMVPRLGPLANNGGPTQTHAVLKGSSAIDRGVLRGCPKTDQRGQRRPQNGDGKGTSRCDIGAFEKKTVRR